MTQTPPLIAGNWKMNGIAADLVELRALAAGLGQTRARVAICPPSTLIARMAAIVAGQAIQIGGQDCRSEQAGAFTGDIAAEMLADAGASLVILGHSERRAGYGETDLVVASKVLAALRAGLEPIICVGETLDERQAGRALDIVTAQVNGSTPLALAGQRFSVAYEPVWAIGTGLTPSRDEIIEVHGAIRATLAERFGKAGNEVAILYGGSVKPSNAADILSAPNVNGALVGGASLKAADFLGIIAALG